jgi:hypothetical protein
VRGIGPCPKGLEGGTREGDDVPVGDVPVGKQIPVGSHVEWWESESTSWRYAWAPVRSIPGFGVMLDEGSLEGTALQ